MRILTWNTWNTHGVERERVIDQALRVKNHADGFDVILLNEVFGDGLQAGDLETGPRDVFYDTLHEDFPYVVYKTFSSQQFDLRDSGLMAFSRHPFVRANNDGDSLPSYKAGIVAFIPQRTFDPSPFVRFLEFDDSCNTDKLAAKGVALFHIEPPGGRRYNIALTHMNAGSEACAVDARDHQLEFVRTLINDRVSADIPSETIVAGDLNIDGWYAAEKGSAERPDPGVQTSEYQAQLWGSLGRSTQSFFDTWRTTSPKDEGVTNNLGAGEGGQEHLDDYIGNHRYDYFLLSGFGYHVPGAQTWTGPAFPFMAAPNAPSCVNWVRTTLKSTTSDHYGVALELGPQGPGCNPAMAEIPDNLEGLPTPYVIGAPGADRWFHVPPGTYTFGLARGEAASGLSLEVFSSRNLSRGIHGLPDRAQDAYEPGPCNPDLPCVYKTNRFFGGQEDLYVRVFSPTGRTFGRFHLLARRHDCSSEDNACEIMAGAPFSPNAPTDREYKGFFTFSPVATINSSVPQHLSFKVASNYGVDGKLSASIYRDKKLITVTPWRAEGISLHDEAQSASYLLEVARSDNHVAYYVEARTDLTLVSGAKEDMYPAMLGEYFAPTIAYKLVCIDEGGQNFAGDEEIGVEVWADGVRVAGPPTLFRADLDADEGMDMSSLPPFGFVNEAHLHFREHEGESHTDPVDDEAVLPIEKLAPWTASGERRQRNVTLRSVSPGHTLGASLQFQYFASHGRTP